MATDVVPIGTPTHHGELVPAAAASLPDMLKMADLFKESGMFKDVQSVAAAFVKIQAGAEMGVQPFQAMSGIHVIQGKPVVGAALLAGLVDAHPYYSYRVDWTRDDSGAATACSVTIAKSGKERGTATFSLADAERAGLPGRNPTWHTYPENMLFARAMSNAVRWYAGAVTGGAPVYVEGEVEELEPVDLDELAKKASEEPLNQVKATRDEKNLVGEALTAAKLTAAEGKTILREVAGVEKRDELYGHHVPAVIEAIRAEGERRLAAAESDAGKTDAAASDTPDGLFPDAQ